ncbi:NAD(P)-dependent alcohol dehydrogenase [Candidatus Nitrospira allomarina]|uniref:NAD(P)-dependent alcohol dehydrogenase n=1 Tax=Candidatus Nitrospira allomarina TaxID=3020900 RepID=A0AA96GHC3_9BACT|nr:NAD(P)-dependent alcohol dehydrogenase [Candidatus Nitrospira allomarina]WNM57731.1 NAD(P)-dependent alcohol dehydrogenase [Candidatus Nitrospira allomarina]
MKVYGYGTKSSDIELAPVTFERKDAREGEVEFKVLYCGVCHSDLHQIKNDWNNSLYPCVPGHEILGEVTAVGEGVTKFEKGDLIGVGCMVNSCQECDPCKKDAENYCQGPKSCTLTYNGPKNPDGTNSYGGYTTNMVVREEFGLTIPENLDPKYVGPIMCAGITVYSTMIHWNLEEGKTLGVAGIGGLGNMAIKLGKALGAEVVAFTRSEDKRDEILEMGADKVVISKDEDEMKEAAQSLDLLINTIPVPHDIAPYIDLMKTDSTIVIVGNMIKFPEFSPGPMVFNRIQLAGSLIGGIKETQEVLELCAKHDIKPSIKMIKMDEINNVLKTLENGNDVDFRHVIDMESLHSKIHDIKDSATELDQPIRGNVVNRKSA